MSTGHWDCLWLTESDESVTLLGAVGMSVKFYFLQSPQN
jgi:hypothetical protein